MVLRRTDASPTSENKSDTAPQAVPSISSLPAKERAGGKTRIVIGILLAVSSGLVYWSATSTLAFLTGLKAPALDILVEIPINIMNAMEISSFEAAVNLMRGLSYGSIVVGAAGLFLAVVSFFSSRENEED